MSLVAKIETAANNGTLASLLESNATLRSVSQIVGDAIDEANAAAEAEAATSKYRAC